MDMQHPNQFYQGDNSSNKPIHQSPVDKIKALYHHVSTGPSTSIETWITCGLTLLVAGYCALNIYQSNLRFDEQMQTSRQARVSARQTDERIPATSFLSDVVTK